MKLFCCSLLVSVSCWAQEPIDYFDQAFLSGANLLPPIVQIKQVEVAASDIGMLEFREQELKVTKKSGLFPLVSNGDQLVITGQTGQILVLDQITGQELWRDQWSDWVFPPACVPPRRQSKSNSAYPVAGRNLPAEHRETRAQGVRPISRLRIPRCGAGPNQRSLWILPEPCQRERCTSRANRQDGYSS